MRKDAFTLINLNLTKGAAGHKPWSQVSKSCELCAQTFTPIYDICSIMQDVPLTWKNIMNVIQETIIVHTTSPYCLLSFQNYMFTLFTINLQHRGHHGICHLFLCSSNSCLLNKYMSLVSATLYYNGQDTKYTRSVVISLCSGVIYPTDK